MQSYDLSGCWLRRIDGVQIDTVQVPGSYPPVGAAVWEREFDLPWTEFGSDRLFLVTDGVLASASFSINGHAIGQAGAWATYRFEIPAGVLQATGNRICAEVKDLVEDFGPVAGRRCDAGLVRALRLERRPAVHLTDMRFRTHKTAAGAAVTCTVGVEIAGADSADVDIVLRERDSGCVVAHGQARPEAPFVCELTHPRLWSPERPDLYVLEARLGTDSLSEQVGIRHIEVRGHDLWLNGKRLLLKGVCRHEFTDAEGYAPSEATVRLELERIRHAGFNYMRLVHSPQAACVCRIAAELGLLVSEEPGTCWNDLANERVVAPAVECLRRTILRDRNVPSILAWFIYNECNPNTDYAVRIARMCRELDPDCLLSMADCSGDDAKIREMAAAANISFYGVNIYASCKGFIERLRTLVDRPLLVTEWSGFLGQGNTRQLKALCDLFVRHSQPAEPLRLIGGSIWVWADYEEHSRPSPASIDGWTVEGLVHADGRPKPDLQTLSQMCFEMEHPPQRRQPRLEVLAVAPQRAETWQSVELAGISTDQAAQGELFRSARQVRELDSWLTVPTDHDGYAFTPAWPRLASQLVDGIPFTCRDHATVLPPLLLGKACTQLVIPVKQRVNAVAILGQVGIGGYPGASTDVWKGGELSRPYGHLAAEYEFVFANGSVIVPLRHGIEILRHNAICRWWTPVPRSPVTKPALRAVLDARYEVLRLDLWERAFPADELREIRWRLVDTEAQLLTAGISVRLAACRT